MLSLSVKHLQLHVLVMVRLQTTVVILIIHHLCIPPDEQAESATTVDLVEYYQNSNQRESVAEKLAPILESACVPRISKQRAGSYATGFFWQVSTITSFNSELLMVF